MWGFIKGLFGMGGGDSKPAAMGGGESRLLEKPWREMPDEKDDLYFVKYYHLDNNEVKHLRILLNGPVGAGKSSFINSVESVLQGRVTGRALTDATSETSFTTNYKTYKLHKDKGGIYSVIFNDTMGFEKRTKGGVLMEDIILALKGHVKDGYQFKPEQQMTKNDPHYNPSPTLDDRVHVLVSVLPADSLPAMTDEHVKKMRDVRLAASDMEIPQLIILTKIDQGCPETKKNIKNAYRSKYLKKLVEECHKMLGIPVNCIFLVKNYESEIIMNGDINVLIRSALRQMINFGEDYLNNLLTSTQYLTN